MTRVTQTCQRCFRRRALKGSDYCTPCAQAVAAEETRGEYDRRLAVRRARRLVDLDVRQALAAFGAWSGALRPLLQDSAHVAEIGRRAVATLDGRDWFAGVVVAGGDSGLWLWLVADADVEIAGRELAKPCLKVGRDRCEVIGE
jgi:hypothetical protein